MKFNLGRALAIVVVICGAIHLNNDKSVLYGIEGVLIMGIGALMASTEKIVDAIKENRR